MTQANYGQMLLGEGQPARAVAMLWEAYTALRRVGYTADAGTMEGLLAAVRTQVLGPDAFDQAWAEAVAAPQPGWLREARAPAGVFRLPDEQRRMLVHNTVTVLTAMPERRAEWREAVADALAKARPAGLEDLAALNEAILALLDGGEAELPADNEYRATWQEILDGVAAGRPPEAGHEGTGQVMPAIQAFVNADGWAATRAVVEAQRELLFRPEVEAIFEENIRNAQNGGDTRRAGVLQQHLDLLRACQRDGITAAFERLEEARRPPLPFDEELIPRTVGALRGSPAEKLAHFQHVTGLAASTTDPELKAFLGAIQMALVGGDLRASGEELKGVYAQAWGAIVLGVAGERLGQMLGRIASNTLAVLGPAADRREEWRANLAEVRNGATAAGDRDLVALIDAVLALLAAGGNPAGLGAGLAGPHAAAWQAIVAGLHA